MLLIENTDNMYWDATVEGFGPLQNATEYEYVQELPVVVENNHGETLFLQVLKDDPSVVCYHSQDDGIEAFVIPNDNVSVFEDSGITCPNCEEDMMAYQTTNTAMRVCICGYSEEM